ncbi:MAG: sensor histidine kinase [Anaerolineaceae bacterium]|nr:sensor histidine kinase [Anaerolineaceae bacterium]
MRELALHILDIAENSISAGATRIMISVEENQYTDRLVITIEDNGKGMDAETLARITDPFITSRTTRNVGLGIPFFKAAAEACEGLFKIQSRPGKGTTVKAEFKRSHIDRMPLGDLAGTLQTLIIGTPDVHWIFEYRINDEVFRFDDEPVKEILDGVPLSDPSVMRYIRDALRTGIEELRQDANLPNNN